jgi:hypothetical protein
VVVVAGFLVTGGKTDAMPPATSTIAPPPPSPVEVTSLPGQSTAEAPPLGSTTTTTTPRRTTTRTSTSAAGPPKLNYEVIGPTGFRGLTLGQSLEDAQATGMLNPTPEVNGGCSIYELVSDDRVTGHVYVNAGTVQAIEANPTQTPQGVGPGWTFAQVHTEYGEFSEGGPYVLVTVPGNPYAHFHLKFTDGKVTTVGLQLTYYESCY